MNILEGENLKEAYLEVNPWGMLPSLELDDGTVIPEAPCIFRYLESMHPEPNLLGKDPKESAAIEAWERFAEMSGMHAIGEVFRNQTEALADRAMPGFSGVPLIPELVERGKKRAAYFYDQMEKRLGDDGRVLVRASGTEPLVRVMVEAQTSAEAAAVADELAIVVRRELGSPVNPDDEAH